MKPIEKTVRIWRRLYNMCYYVAVKNSRNRLRILDIDDTIDYIMDNKCSVSRFGDGELDYVLAYRGVSVPEVGFQKYDVRLAKALHKMLTDIEPVEGHMIALPCCLSHGVFKLRWEDMRYWQYYVTRHLHILLEIVPVGKEFMESNFTRFYMPWRNKMKAAARLERLRMIWKDRDILIIEGEKSRLGVGNEIFGGANSIRRILAPQKDAYSYYDEILDVGLKKLSEYISEPLVLIALGPTATLLAHDIAKHGYQAIDIGHIDIEYEWMLMGAKKKMPVKGKYVNEVKGGDSVINIADSEYNDQIIARIL